MKKNYYILLICFCAGYNVVAAQDTPAELASFKEKVDRAMIKFENTNKQLWSYNIFRYQNEEGDISSSIEQHLPQANEPWLLKQINGQPATNEQIKKFAKKQQTQTKNIQFKLRKLINEESLSIVSADEKHIVMAFNVFMKKLGKDSIGKLQGKLIYQKEQQFIQQISIWNNAAFTPMFTANITDLAITLTFVNINGAILSKQNEMKMKGSFAYITEINETSLDTFSNYLYQGEQDVLKN
jgi:hypothetical protein